MYMRILGLFGWLLSAIFVFPIIGFCLHMMLGALYDGVGHFLADVMKDGSVDQPDNGDISV